MKGRGNRPACSLVVSTYNWPEALALTLKSIKDQSVLPDEVIIADDGSGVETRLFIEHISKAFPVKLTHLWQEDRGFRLSQIRNKAIAMCNGDYVIQIDGDLLLDRHFIQDHLSFAEPGFFLQGSRVLADKKLTERLLQTRTANLGFFTPGLKRRENAFRMVSVSRYLLSRYRNRYPVYYARGANMSFWKKDLVEINGYDEQFVGWGHEDSDLSLRLINYGLHKRVIKFAAIVYHLHHEENKSKQQDQSNRRRLEESFANGKVRASSGLDQYLGSDETGHD